MVFPRLMDGSAVVIDLHRDDALAKRALDDDFVVEVAIRSSGVFGQFGERIAFPGSRDAAIGEIHEMQRLVDGWIILLVRQIADVDDDPDAAALRRPVRQSF